MSQDSKVLSRAFLGIGLILLVISAIIFITIYFYQKRGSYRRNHC